jgi:hypothetical protein
MAAAVNPEKTRALEGIWLAIRRTPDMPPITCSQCFTEVRDEQIYNERMWGEPNVICIVCVQNMVEARMGLIAAGG